MHGFEIGAQQNEGLETEFEIRLEGLREALAIASLDQKPIILDQIEELKRDYREQARRLEKLRVT